MFMYKVTIVILLGDGLRIHLEQLREDLDGECADILSGDVQR